jgi:hypothetical protein
MSHQHIVDVGEAKGEDVAADVEVSTMPSTASIATARTTPLQVDPKDGAQTLPRILLQLEGVEEAMSPISDINNILETSQTSKGQICLKTAYQQIIDSILRGPSGLSTNSRIQVQMARHMHNPLRFSNELMTMSRCQAKSQQAQHHHSVLVRKAHMHHDHL